MGVVWPDDPDHRDTRVQQLLAAEHHRFLRVNLPVSAPMSIVAAFLLARHAPWSRLALAVGVVVLFCTIGYVVLRSAEGVALPNALRRYAFMNFLGGLAWGIFMVMAMPTTVEAQLFLGGMVPFVMAINMIESSSVPQSFIGFHVPYSSVSIASFALWADGEARWMALVFVITAIYVPLMARVAHKNACERAELMVHNQDLIDGLNNANADLAFQSHHDRLTGLPNRRALERSLSETFFQRSRPGYACGEIVALFIDLDRFKDVNDTLGHDAGDELLKLVALRLGTLIGTAGFVARMGGDEMVVLLTGAPGATPSEQLADAERVAGDIVGRLNEPFSLEQGSATVGASVGIAMTSPDCVSSTSLLRQADHALYDAKALGRNQYVTFDAAATYAAQQRDQAQVRNSVGLPEVQ